MGRFFWSAGLRAGGTTLGYSSSAPPADIETADFYEFGFACFVSSFVSEIIWFLSFPRLTYSA